MLLMTVIDVVIGLFVFLLALRMFIPARDAYFNPMFSGIYRGTDPVMKPIYKIFRRKPVDISGVDFLVLIPIFLLILADGLLRGVLVPNISVGFGVITSFWRFADVLFQAFVILILVFSIFYKYARYPSNPFIRTGFKIMEPVYAFIGRAAPPLKEWPGITAFFIGLFIHFAISFVIFYIIYSTGQSFLQGHPGGLALWAIRYSMSVLLLLASFFTWMIIIGALMSWISPDPNNPIVEIIRLLSEPINRPFRRIIPSIGGIDISPIFSILALQLVARAGNQLLNFMLVAMPHPA